MMIMKFRNTYINRLVNQLKEAVAFKHPPRRKQTQNDDRQLTIGEFFDFIDKLKAGFDDLADDLENIRKELERLSHKH